MKYQRDLNLKPRVRPLKLPAGLRPCLLLLQRLRSAPRSRSVSPSLRDRKFIQLVADAEIRRLAGNGSEPFTIVIAGLQTYVLTDPRDIKAAYANTSSLSFHKYVEGIMKSLRCSETSIRAMFDPAERPEGAETSPKTLDKSLSEVTRTLHAQQLGPGPRLEALEEDFVKYFVRRLDWDHIQDNHEIVRNSTGSEVRVDLYTWVSDIIVSAGQEVFFGEALEDISPHFVRDFLEFDIRTWQVIFGLPRLLSPSMHRAKDSMTASLEAYFAQPATERPGTAWFTVEEEREMRRFGLSDGEIATMMLLEYWG